MNSYHYYIYPFKGITLTNFKLLQTLSEYLARMIPKETETILTIETDGISVATCVAAELSLPLIICKSFYYNMPAIELPQKTGYYERQMYLPRIIEGKKVAIVDCMMSTGGTVKGMIETIIFSTHALIMREKYFAHSRRTASGHCGKQLIKNCIF